MNGGLLSLCFPQLAFSESKLPTKGFVFWKGHATSKLFSSNTTSQGETVSIN